jgi:hypothetical protein
MKTKQLILILNILIPKKMKTRILTIAFLTLIILVTVPAISNAQTVVGLRQGVAATTLSDRGNLYRDNKITCSYTAGVFSTIPLNRSLSLQPELTYIRKGRSNETTELNSPVETDFMVHYLQVPVLLQYHTDKVFSKPGTAFYINAGPYAAFAVNTQYRVSKNSGESTSVDLPDQNTGTDWGATFGIGIQTPVRGKDVRFDLRYDLGLSDIDLQPAGYNTKALSFTVGMLL